MWSLVNLELRREARSPTTYWLRSAIASIILMALLTVTGDMVSQARRGGGGYLKGLSVLILGLIWMAVPVMTADCISREKREGTLPLLFLTSLSPLDIVVAKSIAHFVRALTLLLASIPMLMIPFLMGGVQWHQIVRIFCIELGAVGMALAAGLAASALSYRWVSARILAAVFALTSALIFVLGYKAIPVLWHWSRLTANPTSGMSGWEAFGWQLKSIKDTLRSSRGIWMPTRAGQLTASDLWLAMAFLCFTAVLVVGGIMLAVVAVRRNWREVPGEHRRSASWLEQLSRPMVRAGQWFKSRRNLLQKDPIAWLQCSTVFARLARLGWIVIACVIAGTFAMERPGIASELLLRLGILLLLGMGSAASGSFRKELESGALELLLVSPLKPRQILRGRVRGLLWQFFPALLAGVSTLTFLQCCAAGMLFFPIEQLSIALVIAALLVVMGRVGIALSLSGLPYAASFALSVLLVGILPLMLIFTAGGPGSWILGYVFLASVQLVNFWWSWRYARRQLEERRFLPGVGASTPMDASLLASLENGPSMDGAKVQA